MVLFDIMLAYDDTSDALSAPTRPALIHFVADFYDWKLIPTSHTEEFQLIEICVELLDNGPEDTEFVNREEL